MLALKKKIRDALHVEIKAIKKKTALRKSTTTTTTKKKNLQKSALAAVEKCIEPKNVNLNLILKKTYSGKLQGRNTTPSRSPSTKTRGKFHLFPQTLNIQQCCPDIPALNYFTLKQSSLEYLLDFLDPCPHKASVFYLADLV